jgi:hypothetical protein
MQERAAGEYPPQAVLASVRATYEDEPVRAEDLRCLFDEPDLDRLDEALEDLYRRGELLKADHLSVDADEGYVPTDEFSI